MSAEANNKYWGGDPISEERYNKVIPDGDPRRNDYEAGFLKATNMGAIGTPRHFYALGYTHCVQDKKIEPRPIRMSWLAYLVSCAGYMAAGALLCGILRTAP